MEIILRLAGRLLPGLEAPDEARIRTLQGPHLEALADALPDLADVAALRSWLDRQGRL